MFQNKFYDMHIRHPVNVSTSASSVQYTLRAFFCIKNSYFFIIVCGPQTNAPSDGTGKQIPLLIDCLQP